MAPRTALVTGGTDGIGKEIARRLVNRGARVWIVGSNAEKGRRAEAELCRAQFLRADLSRMREVHGLSDLVLSMCPSIDCLVLCAGSALYSYTRQFKKIEAGSRTSDPAEGQHLWEFSERYAASVDSSTTLPSNR